MSFFSRRRFVGFAFILAFATAGLGERLPMEEDRERGALAESYVTARLAYWQQQLDLESWKVTIVMSRRAELKPNTLGHINWDEIRKTARIQVLDAADYKLPVREMLDDMELTVVHELVHLELASLPHNEASRMDEEHIVNQIALALLRSDRRK